MNRLSALSYLSDNITKNEKQECLKVFIDLELLAYDYEQETFVDPNIVLSEEYFDYDSWSFQYKTEDLTFSCSEDENFFGYVIDGDNNNSEIILEISDKLSKIPENLIFLYIDLDGDRPDYLPNSINNVSVNAFFKFNYFGEVYIEKYGKKFFEDFPAKNVLFINDKVVRVDLVDNIFDSISQDTKDKLIKYLRSFNIEKIEFYDAREHQY
jgi:hypothetical protein